MRTFRLDEYIQQIEVQVELLEPNLRKDVHALLEQNINDCVGSRIFDRVHFGVWFELRKRIQS